MEYKGFHDKTDQFLTQKNGLFLKKKQIKIEGEKFQKTDRNLSKINEKSVEYKIRILFFIKRYLHENF